MASPRACTSANDSLAPYLRRRASIHCRVGVKIQLGVVAPPHKHLEVARDVRRGLLIRSRLQGQPLLQTFMVFEGSSSILIKPMKSAAVTVSTSSHSITNEGGCESSGPLE